MEEKTEELDTEKSETIVDRIDALGVASVAFTGGAPMLLTRNCSGCIYTCYFLTQRGVEFRYWPDLIKKYILLKR
jgi:hypothetical protein